MADRRQLKTRSNPLAIKFARYISGKSITPNQISLFSILLGGVGFLTLWTWQMSSYRWLQIMLLLLSVVAIQGRLLCNMIDGMVAIEGGKITPDGELFNDAPDRLTDILFFSGLGLGLSGPSSLVLGLILSLLAVLTAYVRVLGSSMGTPAFFIGPFAKQHRMAILTLVILLTILGLFYQWGERPLYGGLILLTLGTLFTIFRRLTKIRAYLLKKELLADSQDEESLL